MNKKTIRFDSKRQLKIIHYWGKEYNQHLSKYKLEEKQNNQDYHIISSIIPSTHLKGAREQDGVEARAAEPLVQLGRGGGGHEDLEQSLALAHCH